MAEQQQFSEDRPIDVEGESEIPQPMDQTGAPQTSNTYPTSNEEEQFKEKIGNYDIDGAISDLSEIVYKSSEMYCELKKLKFDYLSQAFELYSRIDFPSLMMIKFAQTVQEEVPSASKVEQLSANKRNGDTAA